jgi:hypothetical protein
LATLKRLEGIMSHFLRSYGKWSSREIVRPPLLGGWLRKSFFINFYFLKIDDVAKYSLSILN